MVGCARLKYFVACGGSGADQTEGHKGREPQFLNSADCDTERGRGDMLIS